MDGSIDMCISFKQYLLSVYFVPDFGKQISWFKEGMKETKRARKRLKMQTTSKKRR